VDDLKGSTLFGGGLIAPRSRRAVVGIARALAAQGAAPPQEIVLLRGGRHVVVESNQRIVRAAGESIEVEVILRDLTERRRAEEAARLRAFAAHLESLREDERGRLARSLHDDFAQSLAALGLQIGWLTRALPNELAEPNAKVREMGSLLSSMMQTVRQMTRELRPPVLDDFGLATAVHWEAHAFRERTGIDCVMHIERDEAQDTDARVLAVFRTVQEALANVAARGATSVRVELDAGDSMIAVRIEDDGPALPSAALPWDIVCMRERAHLLGGSFEIESPAAGGMSLHLRVPREVSPA
jgi:signal transduction histidine kinase